MKEIQLTQGKVALVDDEDFEWLNQYNWCVALHSGRWYAERFTRVPKRRVIFMHRFILWLQGSTPEVDHKDGNGLNNQRENLRTASHKQNMRNSVRTGSPHMRGTYLIRRPLKKPWAARIRTDEGRVFLGYFATEAEAASAYDAAALVYHGEFARTNAGEASC